MGRAIDDNFLKALKAGEFAPIVNIVREDDSLSLHLRGTYVTIYYKSCRILEITPGNKNPYKIDEGYNCPVKPDKNTENWQDYFMRAKCAIDNYSNLSWEEDIQQRIIQENNFSRDSNGTDYFIVDKEYTQSGFKGKFDLIAAFWPKNKRRSGKNIKLVIIEVKSGETAIDGGSGMIKHLGDAKSFLSPERKQTFASDIEKVFTQLRELELVRFGQGGNPHDVTFSRTDFQFIFVIADYNQNSTKLRTALKDLNTENLPFELLFATSSFMGYGLYEEGMLRLDQFKALLKIEEKAP